MCQDEGVCGKLLPSQLCGKPKTAVKKKIVLKVKSNLRNEEVDRVMAKFGLQQAFERAPPFLTCFVLSLLSLPSVPPLLQEFSPESPVPNTPEKCYLIP